MPDRHLQLEPPHILLVEDNLGDIRLLQEAFKEAGLTCRLNITRDGEQAMAFLHRRGIYSESPRPSLILLDLNLPRKDGREVLAEIKDEKQLRTIPVVILSTSTNPDDVRRAYELHANCYFAKPGDVDSLMKLGTMLETFWLKSVLLPN
jgi:chemotaxis family two-component system response regulator Rcp1